MSTITPLPEPPRRTDPVNFAARADEFLAALPVMVDQFNAAAFGSAAELGSDLADTATAGKGDARIGLGQIVSAVGGVQSRHATLAAAIAAIGASSATLTIRGAINVSASVVVPATISVEVECPGTITISSGQTVTINGSFHADQRRVFFGAGSVIFGSTSRSPSPPVWTEGASAASAVYSQKRLLTQSDSDLSGPVHGFEDRNTLNFTTTPVSMASAYATFDSQTTMIGSCGYDHMVAFQARQTFSGSVTLGRFDSFNSLVTHDGVGTVNLVRGVHIENPLGSGAINNLYGVHVERLNRGGVTYGFYSETSLNVVATQSGESASWLLRGNGQTGAFGLFLQSASDSTARVLNTANTTLRFGTNNVDTGFCLADGRWKLAPNSADLINSVQQLEVIGTGGASLVATGSAGNGVLLGHHRATSGDNLFVGFYTEASATLRGSIDFNRTGAVARYNTTSDGNLKNLIGDAPIAKSLEILSQVRLREFAWKEDPTQKPQIGVIAQELQKTFRGAVSVGGEYEESIPAVTEQRKTGQLADDGTELHETVVVQPARVEKRYRPWAVDKTAFTWHLVAGWQQHEKRLTELEARIAHLQSLLIAAERRLGGGGGGPKEPT